MSSPGAGLEKTRPEFDRSVTEWSCNSSFLYVRESQVLPSSKLIWDLIFFSAFDLSTSSQLSTVLTKTIPCMPYTFSKSTRPYEFRFVCSIFRVKNVPFELLLRKTPIGLEGRAFMTSIWIL